MLIPTSTTTAPSFIISAVINFAFPAQATTISAFLHSSFRSFVLVWHTVIVAWSFNIIIANGFPTTILRPTIVTFFPVRSMWKWRSISITACAVHGACPSFSPKNTLALLNGLMQSTSFSGAMASMTAASSSGSGKGSCTKIPSTSGARFRRSMSVSSSACVVCAGSR